MKGISNLITTVMVLAVAITMVSVFSGWAPGLLGDVTTETGNQTDRRVDCNQARLSIESVVHYDTQNTTSVVVENKSRTRIGDVRLEAWNSGVPSNSTKALITGQETVNITYTNSTPTKVDAISTLCSNAQDSSTDINSP
ncbi:MAG: hypothetical protein ABEJ03_03015 [Candidatus Nanohaloarchaea archaeon]